MAKLCPMKLSNSRNENRCDCEEGNCAWWVNDCCAIIEAAHALSCLRINSDYQEDRERNNDRRIHR